MRKIAWVAVLFLLLNGVSNSKELQSENYEEADKWFKKGDSFYKPGSYDEAIIAYTKALELNPRHAEAMQKRGCVWFAKKDYKKAIDDFTMLLEMNPEISLRQSTYHYRGMAWAQIKDYDRAIADHTKELEILPGFSLALHGRGHAWLMKGEKLFEKKEYQLAKECYRQSLVDFKKALINDPQNKKYQEAIKFINNTLENVIPSFEKIDRLRERAFVTATPSPKYGPVLSKSDSNSSEQSPIERNNNSASFSNFSLPENGKIFFSRENNKIAPLRIVTSGEKVHYLVKLTDWNTGNLVQTIFVRAGHTAETNVPLGSCRLKYAAGETWLGDDELFGEKTIFSKAQKRFDFVRKGNQVSGYAVELILQRDGNLSTVRIPKSEW